MISPASTPRPATEAPRMGRYVVERELARGAMGVVYRASDLSSGRTVALKQLLEASPRQVQMFEREYHVLKSLHHPRIIEVYDYGLARDGAYYTMELLDGTDLRELAPLSFQRTCAYLRDIASSLGLLHARRMLHRDLSPRNVRITSDDRAKLIDFGGLTSFGVPNVVIGTPPCVPPEALHHAALDQRADLFALGAVAYWVLTRRHAYPARELAELPEAWRTSPAPPSEVVKALGLAVPDIPPELDALVMALLTLNPLGRPASVAEVIDRLEQIGGLPRDRDDSASRSYLLGVATIGRTRERARLQRRLKAALGGKGSSVVLEGATGMGRTRLLGELAVDAQLAGALPLMLDAKLEQGAYGIVHRTIAKLLEAVPDDALAAAEGHGPILARFSPELRRALAIEPDATDFGLWPGELRKRTQGALADWLCALTARRPLLLAVDNAQAMDEASAALVATLAAGVAERALLVVSAFTPGEQPTAALRALRAMGGGLSLSGLSHDEVHGLVRSMFGEAQNTGRLADWMHRLSAGNPGACMELAAELVERNVVRYLQGEWVLPQELPEAELPRSLDAIIAARLRRLEPAPRSLAEALAVHRSALPLEGCLEVAHALAIDAPYDALQALSRDGVVLVSAGRYLFAHDAVRAHVLAAMPEEKRRELHRLLGKMLAEKGDRRVPALLDAGWHLLHGGEEERGAALLADAGLSLTYASDEMSAAVPALRAALEVFRRLRRPVSEQLRLLMPLAMAGYYTDRHLADEYGDETLRLYRRHLGLDLAARLRPFVGRHLSIGVALALTGARFMWKRELGGIAGLQQRIVDYFACAMAMTGVATICLDAATAQRRASHIEPLTVLGRNHAAHFAYSFASILALIPLDRSSEVLEGCTALLARFDQMQAVRDLPSQSRTLLYGGVLYALASLEASRAQSKVLEYADRLEALGLQLYGMVADQLRSNHHALRGEAALADRYRARVELHAMQAGSAWQAEIWAPCSMIAVGVLTRDAIGLQRAAEQLDRLGREIPALALHASMARGEYHFLRGEYEAGLAIVAPLLEATDDRGFIGRDMSLSSQAFALNRLGRHAEAKSLLEPLVARLTEADRTVVGLYMNLFRELAMAHSGLGDHARANAIIDEMLARHRDSDHPLLLGNLHSTKVAIAVAAGDMARALEHLSLMEQAFRPTQNPALIAQWEHMRRELRRIMGHQASEQLGALDMLESTGADTDVPGCSLLQQCQSADQRAQLALDMVVNHVGGKRGFLFAVERNELRLIAPQHGAEPQDALLERLRRQVSEDLEEDAVTVMQAASPSSLPPATTERGRVDYRTYALSISGGGSHRIAGAVAVEAGDRPLGEPQAAFLDTIARALFDGGVGETRSR